MNAPWTTAWRPGRGAEAPRQERRLFGQSLAVSPVNGVWQWSVALPRTLHGVVLAAGLEGDEETAKREAEYAAGGRGPGPARAPRGAGESRGPAPGPERAIPNESDVPETR